MRILFLVYHGFSDHSGISKKIHYQVKGLRENGHDVHLCYYGFAENGHRCRYVDGQVIKDYGTGVLAGIRQRIDYQCIYDYCIREKIEFIYARCFQNANPFLIRFFKKIRNAGIRAVTEIPTYPYDAEFVGFPFLTRMNLKIDQLFRLKLASQMDAIVTFSDAEKIFGQRTIRISNGVDFDSIPLHKPISTNDELHLIGVAEVHYWHGYDRLIAGLGEYYRSSRLSHQSSNFKHVFFHIVGGVGPSEMYNSMYAPGYEELMEKYQIKDHVIFHGQLFGDALTEVFNQCQFAIGSLARHRSGITTIKTLKNREYATRGIPFVYSENDSDFDNQPYVLKVPADDSPIVIPQIISFIEKLAMKPENIRKTVTRLSWKIQMQCVIDDVLAH
ncbi:Glycosyltransferase involved in cell wall bisynthesis [Prevotella communis]|uniref:Glycosyltransferase involved in cell wall bisynthesis n=1 Tax=Prevotella communis TaxID=2913614 RepID=A0A1H0G2T4_9BACT|nr:glycosyltransferase [Prevotella communis]SDO01144.1 Glycosyltransferase involved in cell wall bisynthesis [Prevotella communis]